MADDFDDADNKINEDDFDLNPNEKGFGGAPEIGGEKEELQQQN